MPLPIEIPEELAQRLAAVQDIFEQKRAARQQLLDEAAVIEAEQFAARRDLKVVQDEVRAWIESNN